jgi:hypothetical protein
MANKKMFLIIKAPIRISSSSAALLSIKWRVLASKYLLKMAHS